MTQTISMSSATATGAEAIELPRWRGGRGKLSSTLPQDTPQPSTHTDDEANDQIIDASTNPLINPPAQDPTVVRTLLFTRPILHSDLTITTPTLHPLYHASTHEWNFTLPDIILYASQPNVPKHTLLAAAHFRFSRHARLGFGPDFASLNGQDTHDGGVKWEMCKNTSSWWRYWRWEFSVPIAGEEGRRRYLLLRTREERDGVRGWAGWLSLRNYRVVDRDWYLRNPEVEGVERAEGEGKDVGVFLSDDLRSLTRVGELRLYEEVEEEVLRGIVLALAVVSEEATRRGRRKGLGLGGDGSGGAGNGGRW